MTEIKISNLVEQGEGRAFAAHGHALLANAGGAALLHGTFEPGWRWSQDVAPIAGTERCQVHHLGYCRAGSMVIRLEDGTEHEVRAGDLYDIPRGHDAWVTGEVPCEMLDFSPDSTRYAVGRPREIGPPEDTVMSLVRTGFVAFNRGDTDTLRSLFTKDVVQHVPGSSAVSGVYKGVDAVLGYYGRLAELTDGTFRADLIDVHGDGGAHVLAVHQTSGVRKGRKRVARSSILFTFVGEKATDLLEMHGDLPGDDAFFG